LYIFYGELIEFQNNVHRWSRIEKGFSLFLLVLKTLPQSRVYYVGRGESVIRPTALRVKFVHIIIVRRDVATITRFIYISTSCNFFVGLGAAAAATTRGGAFGQTIFTTAMIARGTMRAV
jgi:hypothetical protein